MERILVAVDFSEGSGKALKAALELSRAFNAKVRVVHVLSSALYGAGEQAVFAELRNNETTETDKALRDVILEQFNGGTEDYERIDRKVLYGSAASAILEEAIWWEASLVVVGALGSSAVRRFLLGSVASRVLSHATMPVLVVHGEYRVRPRKVLAAVDRGAMTNDVLGIASGWCKRLGAQLSVVHVMTGLPVPFLARLLPGAPAMPDSTAQMKQIEREVEAQVEAALPDETRPAVHCRVGNIVDQICACAEEGDFDMVVLGAHERTGPLDLSNTTARVAQHCARSVLVARVLPPADEEEDFFGYGELD